MVFVALHDVAFVTDQERVTGDHERISALETLKEEIEVAMSKEETEEHIGVPSVLNHRTTPLFVHTFSVCVDASPNAFLK